MSRYIKLIQQVKKALVLESIVAGMLLSVETARANNTDKPAQLPVDNRTIITLGGHVDISGTVFLDSNKNGEYDPGERPLSGICVSDGEEIVKTDKNGRYSFTFQLEVPTCIFVTLPSGYSASGSFYWLAASAGKYSHSFGLIEDKKSKDKSFSFIHGGDIQYHLIGNPEQLRYDMETLEKISDGHDVRFYAVAGDLTESGKEENLSLLKSEMKKMKRQFHAGFGGHDGLELYYKKAPSKMTDFVRILGPYAYSWDYGGVHFIALVSELHFLSSQEQNRQFRWLKKDIALQPPDKPVIVMCHIPGGINKQLLEILQAHNLKAVLQGHWHMHNLSTVKGIPVFCSSPWRFQDWGAFTKKCRIIKYADGEIHSLSRILNQEKRLVIVSPQEETPSNKIQIVANVYDTSLKPSLVRYEITDSKGKKLEGNLDQKSDFTWAKVLSNDLSSGKCTIRVKVVAGDSTWGKSRPFEILDIPEIKASADTDWPSIFGPEPKSRNVTTTVVPPLRLRWIAHTGNSLYYFSSPVVYEGRLYLGLHDGQAGFKQAGVICLDAQTGKRFWRTHINDDINSTLAVCRTGIYALSNSGVLHRIDKETGKVIWAKDIYEGARNNSFDWHMTMAPLSISNDKVYTAGPGVACFDINSGVKTWGPLSVADAFYQISGLCTADNRGYIADERKYTALDLQDGNILWSEKIKRSRGLSTPIAYKDTVYVHHMGTLRKINGKDGSVIWEYGTGRGGFNYVGIPAIGNDGEIVVIAFGDNIVAVHGQTGKKLWTFKTPSPGALEGTRYQVIRNGSSPAICGNYVYAGSDNGMFYALDISSGAKVWEYAIGVPIKSSPAISGNMVFITGFDGNIYAFVGETSAK